MFSMSVRYYYFLVSDPKVPSTQEIKLFLFCHFSQIHNLHVLYLQISSLQENKRKEGWRDEEKQRRREIVGGKEAVGKGSIEQKFDC